MKYFLNDEVIGDYSKLIFRFAMSKTGNYYDAEDLSQEIMIALISALNGKCDIVDLNAYIYTICFYTWSKFLRRNKRHFNHLGTKHLESIEDNGRVDEELLHSLDIIRLKKELSHLAALNRTLTIMYYFENKSCDEIAMSIGMSNEAVRWHLFESRRKLREGFNMIEELSLTPRKLWVGHDGNISDGKGQAGLDDGNLLAQNIVLTCYGDPLTIEEISRRLDVAAAYLEYHINDLVYLDYLRVLNKTRYQTNFFITEPKHQLIKGKYHYRNIGPIAESIFKVFDSNYERIKALGFTGSTLDKDFVLWSLIPLYTGNLYWSAYGPMLERNNASRPRRKDGSEHWVIAGFADQTLIKQSGEPEEIIDFVYKSNGNGIKTRGSELGVRSLQLETYAGTNRGVYWRNFNGTELNSLYRIRQITETNEEPNENDKLEIARMVQLGYVTVSDSRPEILVPFLNREQYKGLCSIFADMEIVTGNPFGEYIEGYAELMTKHVPDFISKEERYFVSHDIHPHYAILFYLSDHGFLRYPAEDELKRLATVLWCE